MDKQATIIAGQAPRRKMLVRVLTRLKSFIFFSVTLASSKAIRGKRKKKDYHSV
jgi:hypothetical protein